MRNKVMSLCLWEMGRYSRGYKRLESFGEGAVLWWDDPERCAWHVGWIEQVSDSDGVYRIKRSYDSIQENYVTENDDDSMAIWRSLKVYSTCHVMMARKLAKPCRWSEAWRQIPW
jgi:hypothetical protein